MINISRMGMPLDKGIPYGRQLLSLATGNYFPFPEKIMRNVWIMILKSRASEMFSI
jgi:hypothetical protein